MHSLEKKLFSEFLGTFLFVAICCGTALFTMYFVSYTGVALTFGLTLIALYAIFGSISGCHINPAVSFGYFVSGRLSFKDFLSYMLVQLIGGLLGAALLLCIMKSLPEYRTFETFVTNGYGPLSPSHFGLLGCSLVEILVSFVLVLAYLSKDDTKGRAALSLGAAVIAGHFISLPITGASLNPARSFSVAVIEGGAALKQVWFFFVMPMTGAFLAALTRKFLEK